MSLLHRSSSELLDATWFDRWKQDRTRRWARRSGLLDGAFGFYKLSLRFLVRLLHTVEKITVQLNVIFWAASTLDRRVGFGSLPNSRQQSERFAGLEYLCCQWLGLKNINHDANAP